MLGDGGVAHSGTQQQAAFPLLDAGVEAGHVEPHRVARDATAHLLAEGAAERRRAARVERLPVEGGRAPRQEAVPTHGLVEVHEQGQVGGGEVRLHLGEDLIADQFWSGPPLELDLLPHRDRLARAPLRLTALAWDPAAGVHVDPRVRPDADAPTLVVRRVRVRTVTTTLLT